MNYKTTFNFQPLRQQAAGLFAQALNLHQRGDLEAAHSLYQRVLKLDPKHADALQLMGTLALQQGQFASAIELIQQSLKLNGRNANALNNLGLAYKNLGRFEEALSAFDRAISAQKGFVNAMYNRASVLANLSRLEDALAAFDQVQPLLPTDPELHFRRGQVLSALERHEGAFACFSQTISLAPDHVEALTARAVLLSEAKEFHRALQDFEMVARLSPQSPFAFNNLGNALSGLDRVQDALSCYDRAIQLDPRFVDAHFNAGVLHQSLQQIDTAIADYRKAVEINPEHVLAHWNLGLCQLMLGQYAEGWQQYEWRWKNPQLDVFSEHRTFDAPRWDGTQDLTGKTILLYSEQGLGDTIQFCRYCSLVTKLGAQVVLEVQSPLSRLLSGLDGVAQLIERGAPVPPIDFQCPLLSVPLALRTRLESIPARKAYLNSNSQLKEKWRLRLGNGSALRIGVAWTGRASHTDDHNRSALLRDILSLAGEGVELISLQNELREGDAKSIQNQPGILHFGKELTDMAETAALCDLMDVVVSVDTSIAHLAGALGKPTFVMLPFVPDWRWLLDREDSPWYPTAQLFRQSKKGQWSPVVKQIQLALAQAKNIKLGLPSAAASPETP